MIAFVLKTTDFAVKLMCFAGCSGWYYADIPSVRLICWLGWHSMAGDPTWGRCWATNCGRAGAAGPRWHRRGGRERL